MNETALILAAAAAISSGTPLFLAALGGLITERVGVVNIGIEGIMLVGAAAAFIATQNSSSIAMGIAAGMAAGALMGLLLAFLSVTMRANQIVAGLAIVIFGTGVATFIGRPIEGQALRYRIPRVEIPYLSDIPVVGRIFFQHDIVVYLCWFLAILLGLYLARTRFGLAARAVGENPATADVMGIRVAATQYAYTIAGGLIVGFSGAYLILARVPSWSQGNTTGGMGWIAVALVVFSSWRPLRLLAGAYIFGLALRANFTLQAAGLDAVPAEILAMVPYLLTIVVLIFLSMTDRGGRLGAPAALGRPYFRNER